MTYEIYFSFLCILLATWRFKMNFSVLSASLLPCAFAFCYSLLFSASLRLKMYCIRFCTFGGSLPRIRRTRVGGGNTRAIRCTCAISAPRSLTPAATKWLFSGSSRASRQTIRRNSCEFCNKRRSPDIRYVSISRWLKPAHAILPLFGVLL